MVYSSKLGPRRIRTRQVSVLRFGTRPKSNENGWGVSADVRRPMKNSTFANREGFPPSWPTACLSTGSSFPLAFARCFGARRVMSRDRSDEVGDGDSSKHHCERSCRWSSVIFADNVHSLCRSRWMPVGCIRISNIHLKFFSAISQRQSSPLLFSPCTILRSIPPLVACSLSTSTTVFSRSVASS